MTPREGFADAHRLRHGFGLAHGPRQQPRRGCMQNQDEFANNDDGHA